MNNIFDLTTTDMPLYDYILEGKKSTECGVEVSFEIKEMKPIDYLKMCAEVHDSTLENQYMMIYEPNVKELEGIVRSGKKLPLPVISYVYRGQEGRHRAILAERLGVPFYVMVVKEKK